MFVLKELDRILAALASRGREKERSQLSLADIPRFNVVDLHLDSKVELPLSRMKTETYELTSKLNKRFDSIRLEPGKRRVSTDVLLANLIEPRILSKLRQIPERHYPSARVIVSDDRSYDMLLKFNRIISRQDGTGGRNFLHKPPFNITAIFLISEIVDIFNRERAKIILYQYDDGTKKSVASYDYNTIRKIFPYIRMSDLIVLMQNRKDLEQGNFDPRATNSDQILGILSHFAHTTCLIELSPINQRVGLCHPTFDNVLTFPTSDATANLTKLPITYLAQICDRFLSASAELNLALTSISYRSADPHSLTSAVAQIISTSMTSRRKSDLKYEIRNSARVLVLDRFYDLQGFLLHADRYGSFLEQERQVEFAENQVPRQKLDTVGELDEKLQLEHVTQVLSRILEHATSLRGTDSNGIKGYRLKNMNKIYQSSTLRATESIRRHLDLVKILYKCLNEGYLSVLHLEMSLQDVADQLRNFKQLPSAEQQAAIVDRLERISSAYKQLIKIAGQSIKATDLIRVACIIVDVINIFLYLFHGNAPSSETFKRLNIIKAYVLLDNEFKKSLRSRFESGSGEEAKRLIGKVSSFEKLSKDTCSHRSSLGLEQIVEKFCCRQLDLDFYPTLSLSNGQPDAEVLVLLFLGSLTPSEISRLKVLEISLRKEQVLNHIVIINCGIFNPEEILAAL